MVKNSTRSIFDIDIQGVLGEFAFQKLFGLGLKIYDTTCQNFATDTFDAVFLNGFTCDIKTIIKSDLPLLLRKNKGTNPPNLYALMWYSNFDSSISLDQKIRQSDHSPVLEFRGFVSKKELLKDENLVFMQFSKEWYYRATQNQLKNWKDL